MHLYRSRGSRWATSQRTDSRGLVSCCLIGKRIGGSSVSWSGMIVSRKISMSVISPLSSLADQLSQRRDVGKPAVHATQAEHE